MIVATRLTCVPLCAETVLTALREAGIGTEEVKHVMVSPHDWNELQRDNLIDLRARELGAADARFLGMRISAHESMPQGKIDVTLKQAPQEFVAAHPAESQLEQHAVTLARAWGVGDDPGDFTVTATGDADALKVSEETGQISMGVQRDDLAKKLAWREIAPVADWPFVPEGDTVYGARAHQLSQAIDSGKRDDELVKRVRPSVLQQPCGPVIAKAIDDAWAWNFRGWNRRSTFIALAGYGLLFCWWTGLWDQEHPEFLPGVLGLAALMTLLGHAK